MDAVLELKHYSTERLLDLWEMTTTNSDHNIPAMSDAYSTMMTVCTVSLPSTGKRTTAASCGHGKRQSRR